MADLNSTYITVTYDGHELYPTPLVNYSEQPVEFGYVYGYNTDITLEGIITGIKSSGQIISGITNIFTGQFKTLEVNSNDGLLHSWPYITVNSISLEQSPYFVNSFIKYSIKCTSYNIPSGVIDPSNEFSFTENDDGTINVSHKISAKAIRNNNPAFQNAVNFVKGLTGQKPISIGTIFLPSSSGILLSISESINRAEATYSVTKNYRYNTIDPNPNYIRYTSIDIDESMGADYKNASYSLKILGSPIENNINSLYTGLQQIDNLLSIYNEFGFDTTNWVQSSYSANIDNGSNSIDVKIGYFIAANPSGFFDYVVTYDRDNLLGNEIWKIDGDFKCFGPLSYINAQLDQFKTLNKADNWRTYLKNLIQNSPLYSAFHDPSKDFSRNFNVVESEIKEMGSLKLSMTMNMWYEPEKAADLKYSISCSPSRWIYELLPSANIEGAYIIQDLQTKTNSSIQLSISSSTSDKNQVSNLCKGYLNQLETVYVESGDPKNIKAFLIEENYDTGTYDISFSKKYIGKLKNIDNTLNNLISVGSNDSAPVRRPNYNFGY